jgi:hypothetical protein
LDNLKLNDINENKIYSIFQLENIILVGNAIEKFSNAPPRGLQLTLHNKNSYFDTLVMANFGKILFYKKYYFIIN